MAAWEQFTLDGGSVEHSPAPVARVVEEPAQVAMSLDGGTHAGQLAIGEPVGTPSVDPAPLLVAGCALCPTSREEWDEPAGVVHWNLADPRGPGAGVIVHAGSAGEAWAMLRERQGPRGLSPVAHVDARRCSRCSAWSTMRDVKLRRAAIAGAVREVARGLVEPAGAVTVAELVGIGDGCWNWSRVGVVLDELVREGVLVVVEPLVEGACVRYAVPGWDGRLV